MISCCRICLCSKPRRDITELKIPDDPGNLSYIEIMVFCLDIKVAENTKLCTKLCVKCYRKIIQFYQFKELAKKNDAYMHSIIAKLSENEVFVRDHIKDEVFSDSSDCFQNTELETFEIKEEVKEESENELLSVIKMIKYEDSHETKENAPAEENREKQKCSKIGSMRKKKTNMDKQMCAQCGKVVKDLQAHLKVHLPMGVREKESVRCEYCNKLFMSKESKAKHVKRKHLLKTERKECPLCRKKMFNVNYHIRMIHERDSLPFECAICGRKFISKLSLEEHITIHTKDRPFECNCGKKFRTKALLKMHERQVHKQEKSHLCQFCSKSFFKKYHLQNHILSHTKEKPHKCPKCERCFSTTTILKNHMSIHSDIKNHHCTMCDMSFARANYLRAHMLSHVKLKRYPCQYCGLKFHRSDHRKRHEFTAHLKHLSDGSKP